MKQAIFARLNKGFLIGLLVFGSAGFNSVYAEDVPLSDMGLSTAAASNRCSKSLCNAPYQSQGSNPWCMSGGNYVKKCYYISSGKYRNCRMTQDGATTPDGWRLYTESCHVY